MAWTRRSSRARRRAHTAVPCARGDRGGRAAANAALVFGGFDGAALRPNELFAVEASTLATITLHPGDGRRPGRGVGGPRGEVPGSDRGRAPEREIRARVRRVAEDGDGARDGGDLRGGDAGRLRTSRTHARGRREEGRTGARARVGSGLARGCGGGGGERRRDVERLRRYTFYGLRGRRASYASSSLKKRSWTSKLRSWSVDVDVVKRERSSYVPGIAYSPSPSPPPPVVARRSPDVRT